MSERHSRAQALSEAGRIPAYPSPASCRDARTAAANGSAESVPTATPTAFMTS